jgi:hypothetical protein
MARQRLWPALAVMSALLSTASAAATVENLTGLPVYPYLNRATMDGVVRTDTLGRWCRHFSAETSTPLETVETWYRDAMAGASETDLTHDAMYRSYTALTGIKLGIGVNYVNVYKVTDRAPTSIELFRCSPVT